MIIKIIKRNVIQDIDVGLLYITYMRFLVAVMTMVKVIHSSKSDAPVSLVKIMTYLDWDGTMFLTKDT